MTVQRNLIGQILADQSGQILNECCADTTSVPDVCPVGLPTVYTVCLYEDGDIEPCVDCSYESYGVIWDGKFYLDSPCVWIGIGDPVCQGSFQLRKPSSQMNSDTLL